MFFRVLTFQEDGTGDPLKEQTFPITQSVGLQCRWVIGNLPMPSFAARHYCNAAVSSAARQDVGGRACRSVNGVIDSRRKAIAPAARGRPVEFTPTSALDQSGLLVQRRPPGADATLARFRQNVVPQLDDAYNFARFLSRDADAAEYIVQEAFLRA